MAKRNASGQAVAEFAAVVPVIVLFIVLLVEVGLLMVNQLAVERAAREAARAAAVTGSTLEIQQAARTATGLASSRMTVEIGPRPDTAGMVRVRITYDAAIRDPFTGMTFFRLQLHATAAMRVEDQQLL